MKLLTATLRQSLPGPRATENDADPTVTAKFFDPTGSFTWFVTEAWAHTPEGEEVALSDPKANGGEVLFFGLVTSHLCPEGELGTFALSELESVRGALGLGIERDLYFSPRPLSEVRPRA